MESCKEFFTPMEHLFCNRVKEKTERTIVFTYVPELVARRKTSSRQTFWKYMARPEWHTSSLRISSQPLIEAYDASNSCDTLTPPPALCTSCAAPLVSQSAQAEPQLAEDNKVATAVQDVQEHEELDEEEVGHMLSSLVHLDEAEHEIRMMPENIQALLLQHIRKALMDIAAEETTTYAIHSTTAELLPSPSPASAAPAPVPQKDSLAFINPAFTANTSSSSSAESDYWDLTLSQNLKSRTPIERWVLRSPSYYMYVSPNPRPKAFGEFSALWEEEIPALDLSGDEEGDDGAVECAGEEWNARAGDVVEDMDGPSALEEESGPFVGHQSTEPIESEPQSPVVISSAADFQRPQTPEHASTQDQHDVNDNFYDADDESLTPGSNAGDAGEY
ncbi:hypothetical protein DXG03_003251 [Asterophora parasitica]|uniref:Uncharacterized protein n=1 Tax=Asterophora parasitica TaxID=117018 RepID=A0A9P7KG50_9AGAR|nr:hypothetical protein DXG03_003251 [Asterophora parasitica]